jgi:uncharacterized Zn-binding protein involved in type VI secretion
MLKYCLPKSKADYMGEKAIIRQGDSTSHGGTVSEGHMFLIVHGKAVAGVGHKVPCPKCHGTPVIVEGTMNASMMGVSIAVDGMKTSCGATLIASQQTDTIEVGSGAATAAATAASKPGVEQAATGLAAAIVTASNARASKPKGHAYDEQIRVLDEDGNPIANMPYHIRDEAGNVYKGLTDASGCCERVHTVSPQSLRILTGAPALENW